ncbi:MAG: DNA polymerase I [Candidatus Melainabacteria bacterium GWF2_37_15]|nr:MAG: DNA polymerase I [Candidatus Melainabacteria bacterium GWF2_37_15]
MTGKTLILIDGHALAYRQFFALERTGMKTTDNIPTWAVYGFIKALFDILRKVKPDAIAVSFDKGRQTFRVEAYPEYKANRQQMPDSLGEQLGYIVEGIKAIDIPIYEMAGFEADDIIGTIAEKAKQLGHKTLILTGDQDSFQLVDPEKNILVLIPTKGELVEYDRNKIHEKLGVWPENVVDFKGLSGDSSDNIPGVKGIGEKTAVKLIDQFGSVENIYEHLNEIQSKSVKEKLEHDHEMAVKSKYLATIRKDVPIDFDFEHTHFTMPNVENLAAYLKKYQFNSLLKVMPEVLSHCCMDGAPIMVESGRKPLDINVQIVDTQEKYDEFIDKLSQQPSFSLDTETTSLNVFDAELVGMSFGWDNETFYVPDGHNLEKIKPILENRDIHKVLQNAKYDMHIFKRLNIELNGISMDTMLASYVKDPAFKHGLKNQAFSYLGYDMIPIEELIGKGKSQITMAQVPVETVANYACADAKATWELGQFYDKTLTEEEKKLLYDIEQPLVPVLVEMERNGVSIDTAYLKELSDELQDNLEKIEAKIFQLAGEKFNVNSPKQVGEILFEKMQLPVKGKVKTQTGYSTSASVLESLRDVHPIISLLLSHRHYAKLKSTYVDTLPALVNPKTGRIHTSFNQTATTTGRLSSSDPNLQNIPIRTEIGNRIRAAFVPKDKENACILSADYSQIELRLLAQISGDEGLLETFCCDGDVHTDTASKVFNVPVSEVTHEMRRTAKTVNFGIIYGQSSYGLSETLRITPGQAKDIIDKYFKTYPKIKEYMDKTIHEARENGYVKTLYGRKRYLKEDLHSRMKQIREFAERAAINSPLQGTAADMIKLAMIRLYNELKNSTFRSKLILQVHDELVLEVYNDELEQIKELVRKCMELDQPLKVPLVVDIACGPSWMEVKE